MYVIELSGSYTAINAKFSVEVTRKKHSVIDVCARKMIEAGADPEGVVEVRRGSTLCFHARPLRKWADIRGLENDAKRAPFSVAKHEPFPDLANA